jgi:hypothetical protein
MSTCVVEALRWPLVIARCRAHARPQRFDRLRSSSGLGATVALRDGDELWAILDAVDERLGPGASLELAEAELVPLDPERLVALGLALADDELDRGMRTRETGLKVVDVLTPIVDGGVCWILGGAYLGRAKLLEELQLRCVQRRIAQTLVFPVGPAAASEVLGGAPVRQPRDVNGPVRTLWPITELFDSHELAELDPIGTTRIVCGPRMPARGHWPAVDLLASRARALSEAAVESAHIALVAAMLETLGWSERVRADPLFDALSEAREFAAAFVRSAELSIDRLATLDPDARTRLTAAQQLERYFAQALLVDGAAQADAHVELGQALVDCREILAGRAGQSVFANSPR